jgi:hypothetical protein
MFRQSKRGLAVADTLVEFTNLEDTGVDAFRLKHPDFVPAAWWDYKYLRGGPYKSESVAWKDVQADLRKAWDVWSSGKRLGHFDLMSLCLAVFDPTNIKPEELHQFHPENAAVSAQVKSSEFYGPRPRFAPPSALTNTKFGFHKAVFFLNAGPSWRVRVCKCGKPYVAEHPRRKYCSATCPVLIAVAEKRERRPERLRQKREAFHRNKVRYRR